MARKIKIHIEPQPFYNGHGARVRRINVTEINGIKLFDKVKIKESLYDWSYTVNSLYAYYIGKYRHLYARIVSDSLPQHVFNPEITIDELELAV